MPNKRRMSAGKKAGNCHDLKLNEWSDNELLTELNVIVNNSI